MRRIPCDACTRPGLPISIFGLRVFCNSGGSHPSSSSAPPSISTSALRRETTKLGRASTKCGSSVGFARTVTLTLSPPISRASDPKSGKVATTFSFACADNVPAMIADKITRVFFMNQSLQPPSGGPVITSGARNPAIETRDTRECLCDPKPGERSFASLRMRGLCNMASKFVSTVRTENEFELQKERIDFALGQEEVLLEKIVIVLQAEFGKFSRIPGQICRDSRA